MNPSWYAPSRSAARTGGSSFRTGRRPSVVDPVVERAHALHRPVGEPLRERAVARVEALGRGAEAPGRRTRPARRRAARPRRRRAAPGDHAAGPAGTRRRSSAAARRAAPRPARSAPSSTRARQTITRGRASSARAPMCGDSARTPVHELLRRAREVEHAVLGADLLGVGGALLRLRPELRPARSTRRAARPRARPRARRPRPRRPPARPGTPRCAAIGPASSSLTVRWIVTPVSSSPAMSARSTGAAPRQRGRSDGWTLSQSARSSSAAGISRP